MGHPTLFPFGGCALHGAIQAAAALPGVTPVVHSTPGCALRAGLSAGGGREQQEGRICARVAHMARCKGNGGQGHVAKGGRGLA